MPNNHRIGLKKGQIISKILLKMVLGPKNVPIIIANGSKG